MEIDAGDAAQPRTDQHADRRARRGCLLATIDRTVTGAGARLLAAHLAAPLTDPARDRRAARHGRVLRRRRRGGARRCAPLRGVPGYRARAVAPDARPRRAARPRRHARRAGRRAPTLRAAARCERPGPACRRHQAGCARGAGRASARWSTGWRGRWRRELPLLTRATAASSRRDIRVKLDELR